MVILTWSTSPTSKALVYQSKVILISGMFLLPSFIMASEVSAESAKVL